jgi:phage I-like protein
VAITAGYLVDLKGFQFDDDANTSTWIHAMPIGEYDHPVHGKIKLTAERIRNFALSVTNRVRGIDPDIDYDHKANGGDAAGWVQGAEARDDGLWLLVKWTQTAYTKLKEGAYRYFSPEFVDEWVHPKTGQVFRDVLNGGGITNRPFLKDILPINMTEVIQASGGSGVNPDEVLKEIAKLLGLPDGTDPAVILGHLQAKLGGGAPPQHQNPPGGPPAGGPPAPPKPAGMSEDPPKKDPPKTDPPKEGDDPLKQLAEHPVVKKLMETVSAQAKQLDEAAVGQAVVQLTEKARGKDMIVPPSIRDDLAKQLSELPAANRPGLIKLFETMIEAGQLGVKAGETGHSNNGGGKSAADAFNAAITKKLSESNGKLNYADAAELVARENPNLYIEYQRELAAA